MIRSPLSYPGNKAKAVKEIVKHFPEDIERFHDVFCGSGLVALNTTSQTLYLNDHLNETIDLLKYFKYSSTDKVIYDMEEIIYNYNLTYSKNKPAGTYVEYKYEGLSKYNKEGYQKLKRSYNDNPSPSKLFALLVYGFNHYIRFNKKNEFNVPVGKVDFSQSIYEKTIEYSDAFKNKSIYFTSYDFRNPSLYENLTENDLVYFDPPYLITTAPYNNGWNEQDEKDLLNLLDYLNSKNIKFALSNVLESNGKKNDMLIKWSDRYKVHNIRRQYRNANYRRKNRTDTTEVLITNY